MEYRNLGRTGLKVSPLCLGTMMFGQWGNPDHQESIRTIHQALDAGINFVDTANTYSAGESEEIVGKALQGRRHEVVLAADDVGSTEYIIQALEAAPAGSSWAVGTELNLVRRMALAHPDKQIMFLDRTVCYCSTMNRIDLPHLVWALEELVAGRVPNRITVDPDTAHHARVALDQMLALP